MHTTPSGLEYHDLKKGAGEPATRGDIVVVHYTGWLNDGKEFDSSLGGEPFSFKLGVGEVIAGWDEGVNFMMVGESGSCGFRPRWGTAVRARYPRFRPTRS